MCTPFDVCLLVYMCALEKGALPLSHSDSGLSKPAPHQSIIADMACGQIAGLAAHKTFCPLCHVYL